MEANREIRTADASGETRRPVDEPRGRSWLEDSSPVAVVRASATSPRLRSQSQLPLIQRAQGRWLAIRDDFRTWFVQSAA
jgi:hypothetical protein